VNRVRESRTAGSKEEGVEGAVERREFFALAAEHAAQRASGARGIAHAGRFERPQRVICLRVPGFEAVLRAQYLGESEQVR
jgi:hypothetical protein